MNRTRKLAALCALALAGTGLVVGCGGLEEDLRLALERWPDEGIPPNPAAWLMTVAKRRAIDDLRRAQMLVRKHEAVALELEMQEAGVLGDLHRVAVAHGLLGIRRRSQPAVLDHVVERVCQSRLDDRADLGAPG